MICYIYIYWYVIWIYSILYMYISIIYIYIIFIFIYTYYKSYSIGTMKLVILWMIVVTVRHERVILSEWLEWYDTLHYHTERRQGNQVDHQLFLIIKGIDRLFFKNHGNNSGNDKWLHMFKFYLNSDFKSRPVRPHVPYLIRPDFRYSAWCFFVFAIDMFTNSLNQFVI